MKKRISLIAAMALMVLAFVAITPHAASAQTGWAYPAPPAPMPFTSSPPADWGDPSRWDGPETFGRWCPQGSLIVPDEWDPYGERCAPQKGNWAF